MKQFIHAVDDLSLLIKLILAIPMLDIIWSIYRVCCALDEGDTTALIVAIVLFFIPFTWLFDIICIITTGTVWRYKKA